VLPRDMHREDSGNPSHYFAQALTDHDLIHLCEILPPYPNHVAGKVVNFVAITRESACNSLIMHQLHEQRRVRHIPVRAR